MSPPGSSSRPHTAGIVVGIVAGLVVGIFVSFALFIGLVDTSGGAPKRECGLGIALGVAEVAVAAGLGALAWFTIARPWRGFVAGLARGFAATLALMMLAPWPCSLLGAGVLTAASGCAK